jgi:ABC-type polysaccharide/polyol phosphate export permease
MYAHLMHPKPTQEVHVTKLIRQFHRWTSLAFMLVVVAIFAMLGLGQQPAQWIYFVPLAPLFLLMLTGAYMFITPYLGKRSAGARP